MIIDHELQIQADPTRLWAITVDVERWPDSTPTITSIERLDDGPIRVGSSAKVVQPRQRPSVWTVTRLEEPELFEWSTTRGPVTMTARHRIVPVDGGCVNKLSVEFSGLGRRLLTRLLGPVIRRTIATENHGFGEVAEALERQPAG